MGNTGTAPPSRTPSLDSSITRVSTDPIQSVQKKEVITLEKPEAASTELVDVEKCLSNSSQQLKEDLEVIEDPYCVSKWEEGEAECPYNWNSNYRFALSILTSALCFCSTFASSLPSGAFAQIQTDFNSTTLDSTLVTSLFVCGYVVGSVNSLRLLS